MMGFRNLYGSTSPPVIPQAEAVAAVDPDESPESEEAEEVEGASTEKARSTEPRWKLPK